MELTHLAALIPLSCLVACSVVPPAAAERNSRPPPLPQQAVARSAEPAATSIADLRAEGPAALERLLAQYDQISAETTRARLAETIDKVAAQRYATVSRLYWYTDLAAAQAAARASGKPILSLRMLGRLDEDLSCANSRMFRTILYPDAGVSRLLRERFVLHWSSERPVPLVTIDYGDGRTLSTTVTGNSAHYVLDADGHVLDVLPGLYAPSVFREELARAADVAGHIATQEPAAQRATLAAYHRGAEDRLQKQWSSIRAMTVIDGDPRVPTAGQVDTALAAAQRATMSKARVEVPLLQRVDLGADPGKLPDDLSLRVVTAARLFGFEPRRMVTMRAVKPKVRGGILDDSARALIASLLPEGLDREAALIEVERSVAIDTLIDETVLRRQIRARLLAQLAGGALPDFAPVNEWVYADVFLTPASDPWLGMLPKDTYTGLPGGAIISKR